MKLVKILPAIAVFAVALFVMAPQAEAARARNRNTGWKSTNVATATDTKLFSESVVKTGGAANIDIIGENTGGNEVDYNTGGDNDAGSGNGSATVGTEDIVNLSTVNVGQSDSDPEDSAVNRGTGAESYNEARVTNTRHASYNENSNGDVVNFSLVNVNTGDNSASRNTGGGNDVDSGSATVRVSHFSDVNGSDVIIRQ